HGLADRAVQTLAIDRDAAARVGVTAAAIAAAFAARAGASAAPGLVVTATPGPLYVRGSSGLVPLDSVIAIHTEREPREIIHVAQLPAVQLDVTLAPEAAREVAAT